MTNENQDSFEDSSAVDLEVLKTRFLNWISFLDQTEWILKHQGFQKVITPFLVDSGAMESQLEPFDLSFKFGQKTKKYQLPTSPEFNLKIALASEIKDVFEIKSCFRNHELSPHHNPEFTMLEFYKNDVDLNEFIEIVLNLIQDIVNISSQKRKLNVDLTNTKTISPKQENRILKIQECKISDLFSVIGFDLKPSSTTQELKQFARSIRLDFNENDNFDDLYFRLWIEKIEPYFDPEILTLVKFYPPSQAALSKINDDGWADRFEIYFQGLELGNAFNELKGSKALEQRWNLENQKRVAQGKNPHPMDKKFIALNEKLPNCCGIAIGMERLFMAIHGYKNINEFKIF